MPEDWQVVSSCLAEKVLLQIVKLPFLVALCGDLHQPWTGLGLTLYNRIVNR